MHAEKKTIGGVEFLLAPLTFRQVRQLGKTDGDIWDQNVQTVMNSLTNADKHTAITADFLEDHLTLPQFNELHRFVLQLSGLKVGEAQAATEKQTGSTSAAASSPISD